MPRNVPLVLLVALLAVLTHTAACAAPPPRRPVKKPVKKAAPAAKKPAASAVGRLTATTLAPALRAAGYQPTFQEPFQRVKVAEPKFDYMIDFGLSPSGDWLVCMAHLAQIPDLTKVPSPPLIALLSANDTMLGMYFSYDRTAGQLMLNATIPNRNLDPETLQSIVEGVKARVRETQPLWDTAGW